MNVEAESAHFRDLMRIKPEGLSLNAWAVRAGVNRTVWADMRRHDNPSRKTLERLLEAVGSTVAEYEALRLGREPFRPNEASPAIGVDDVRGGPWRPSPLLPVPVLATLTGGEWGEPGGLIEQVFICPDDVIGTATRPESLAGDPLAYGLTIVGDAMMPRFRPGRQILVSPRAAIAIGDDVVVHLRPATDGTEARKVAALIKQLEGRSAAFADLRQHRPDTGFRVEASQTAAIHKIIGEIY